MKINIISIGNFRKNDNYQELFSEYKKRIKYDINLIELKNVIASNIQEQKKLEGINIIKNLSKNFKTIVLDERGDIINTANFANICNKYLENSSGIDFIIGGSDGLSQDVLDKADYKLAIGKMVFPHLMVRVILIEQLYRMFSINNNHPYNK